MSAAVPELIQQAFLACQDRRFDDARAILTEAVALARQPEDQPHLADALARLGTIERDTNHLDLALQHYHEAVSILRRENNPLRLAHAIRHVADIECQANRPDLAAPSYAEALALYRAHPDAPPLDLANALRGTAVFHDAAGRRDQSRPLWLEARDLYWSLNIAAGVREASLRLNAG